MLMVYNKIALHQIRGLALTAGISQNSALALGLAAEISALGFKFDRPLLKIISSWSRKEITQFRTELVAELSVMVGAHVKFVPLFKNFPQDVPEESAYLAKRLIGFLQTYWLTDAQVPGAQTLACGCRVDTHLFTIADFGACPICQMQTDITSAAKPRRKLADRMPKQLKVLRAVTTAEAEGVVQNLLNSTVAYSESAKSDLQLLFQAESSVSKLAPLIPREFVNKENLAFVAALIYQEVPELFCREWFKTMTDILRWMVALSAGDVSLKSASNFKLANQARKLAVSLMAAIPDPLEDMLRYRAKWLRAGEYLHIGAYHYRSQYPKLIKNFKQLREQPHKIMTFNRQAQAAIDETLTSGSAQKALQILATRPGELVRRLDLLLRESQDQSVIRAFQSVVMRVPTPLLLKLQKVLSTRTQVSEFRAFMPKGQMAKIHWQAGDTRKTLTTEQVQATQDVIAQELARRWQGLSAWKQVYIDPQLNNLLVPLVQRNTTKSLSTVARGSRVKYDVRTQTIRMFLYWQESARTQRIDVDLSALAFNAQWQYVTHLSWTSLESLGCTHSGDIQSAPQGAAEFIDIDIARCRAAGIRYVMMTAYSFTGQAFKDFESFAGVMERQAPNSGEIFEAKTVTNKFDLTGDTTVNVPLILDLQTGEILWADLSLGGGRARRVEGDHRKLAMMGKTIVALPDSTPNLFELFSAQARARGAVIHTEKVPGTVYDQEFNMERAKDIVQILANYL